MSDQDAVPPVNASLFDVERWHIARALRAYQGNAARTALALGIDRKTLLRKLIRLEIERDGTLVGG